MFHVPDWSAKTRKRRKETSTFRGDANVDVAGHQSSSTLKTKRQRASSNYNVNYNGYIPLQGDVVDIVLVPEDKSVLGEKHNDKYDSCRKNFFAKYVAHRRPCILKREAASGNHGVISCNTTASSSCSSSCYGETVIENVKWEKAPFSLRSMCEDPSLAETQVRVEEAHMESIDENSNNNGLNCFGRGEYANMSMRRFIRSITCSDKMEKGDNKKCTPTPRSQYYLSTQSETFDDDGRPKLLANPLLQMIAWKKGSKRKKIARADDFAFPLRPRIMGHLVTSNVNLWMGGGYV